MNANEKEYFIAARENLITKKIEDACCHYFKVHEENLNNAEAEFFSAYLGYTSLSSQGKIASATNAFNAMTKYLTKAIKFVKESESVVTDFGDTEEKLVVVLEIIKAYTPITRYLFMKSASSAAKKDIIESGVAALYSLGTAIKNEFGTVNGIMEYVVEPWKEAIALQRKFYGYKYNGINPETYAAEIKKFDPTYTMPNKAGCISLG